MKNILLSFVGAQDPLNKAKQDGPVLTLLHHVHVDEVHLLYTPDDTARKISYQQNAFDLERAIRERNYCRVVLPHFFNCENPVDHTEIYQNLLEFCRTLPTRGRQHIAAVASGTPAMQACWILLAESGDFRMKLIRSNESVFGGPPVTAVKLGSLLPRIVRLRREVRAEQKRLEQLLPALVIDLSSGSVYIGGVAMNFPPVLFGCYCYFAEQTRRGAGPVHIRPTGTSPEMLRGILSYCGAAFPNSREGTLQKAYLSSAAGKGMRIETMRTYFNRINNILSRNLVPAASEKFQILATVKRSSGKDLIKYAIGAPPDKIIMK